MYTTEEKIENYLQINIDDSISSSVSTWISWVKDYIDQYTGTTFEAATETRYYDANGGDTLVIDNVVSVSEVAFLEEDGITVDEILDNTEDYWLYPLNTTVKHTIILNPQGSNPVFPTGKRRVKVTGSFGYSATVPPAIEWVATRMVGDMIRQMAGEAKIVKSENLGEYSVTFEDIEKYAIPEYKEILDKYRVINI